MAVVSPAAMLTVAGTWTAALLVVRETTSPPGGAGAVTATVPVLLEPPITELGADEMVWMDRDEPIPNPVETVFEL